MKVMNGGESAAISISTTSAQTSVIKSTTAVVYATVECWLRQGANPTALSDGTDQYLPAGVQMRMVDITPGNKLAFKAASSGTVYITPDA